MATPKRLRNKAVEKRGHFSKLHLLLLVYLIFIPIEANTFIDKCINTHYECTKYDLKKIFNQDPSAIKKAVHPEQSNSKSKTTSKSSRSDYSYYKMMMDIIFNPCKPASKKENFLYDQDIYRKAAKQFQKHQSGNRECNKNGTYTCNEYYLNKKCICKPLFDGQFCEKIHSDCPSGKIDSTGNSCICDQVKVSNGLISTVDNENDQPNMKHSIYGWCDVKIDYCADYSNKCDTESTICSITDNGYSCSCKSDDFFPSINNPYKCIKLNRFTENFNKQEHQKVAVLLTKLNVSNNNNNLKLEKVGLQYLSDSFKDGFLQKLKILKKNPKLVSKMAKNFAKVLSENESLTNRTINEKLIIILDNMKSFPKYEQIRKQCRNIPDTVMAEINSKVFKPVFKRKSTLKIVTMRFVKFKFKSRTHRLKNTFKQVFKSAMADKCVKDKIVNYF